MDSKAAIKATAADDNWADVSKGCSKADAFEKAATRGRFWQDVESLLKLLNPVANAIHHIGADRYALQLQLCSCDDGSGLLSLVEAKGPRGL